MYIYFLHTTTMMSVALELVDPHSLTHTQYTISNLAERYICLIFTTKKNTLRLTTMMMMMMREEEEDQHAICVNQQQQQNPQEERNNFFLLFASVCVVYTVCVCVCMLNMVIIHII